MPAVAVSARAPTDDLSIEDTLIAAVPGAASGLNTVAILATGWIRDLGAGRLLDTVVVRFRPSVQERDCAPGLAPLADTIRRKNSRYFRPTFGQNIGLAY